MRIESSARMEQRLSNSPRQTPPSHSKKSKRRLSRKSNQDTWPNVSQNDQESGLVAGMEFSPQMLWQSTNVPQNVPGNGQRLFTAISDPSVCGYSPMPMTYTMQPVSLPTMYRMYQPMPVPNIRTVHNRQRHYNKHLANIRPGANSSVANGYESLQENGVLESTVHNILQNGDYTSLPPTANKDSGINGDELNSEHRRYSDPGLGPAGNSARSDSDDSDSVESGSSVTTISRSNKLVLSLIEQMTELKKCNSQLFKELSETKSNLENVKAKLAQCKHNIPADYQPGMLSDLIREIREANRNCEENLITRVKSMLEERCNQQAKGMDELKNQLATLIKEKEESDQRVTKLEEEVTALKLSATNEVREIAVFEEENLALRRELQEARASRTLAEKHAAKCVDSAVSRSVTPVTFDTPCITSTPVRTALTDTCFLLPAIPPASRPFSASSVLHSRSARVAALQPISEADQCQSFATDSEPVSCGDTPTRENAWKRVEMFLESCHNAVTCTNDDIIDIWEKIADGRYSGVVDTETVCEILTKIELEDYLGLYAKEERDARNESEARNLGLSRVLEEDLSDVEKWRSKVEKLMDRSESQNFWRKFRKLCKFHKRGNKNETFNFFSEIDEESEEDPYQDTGILAVSPCLSEAANEDGDCFLEDDDTNRTVTDVPDVVVIGGGSIVPKDLCSMRTLTSRIQTAPSRATYTTAYI